jgi:hypothetical protein
MELVEAFERDCDDREYELRIARLAQAAYTRDEQAGRKSEWDAALDELAAEDLYLMVMLEQAGLVKTTPRFGLPDWRLFVGILPAPVCVGLAVVVFTPLGSRLFPNDVIRLAVILLLLLAPLGLARLRPRQR